MCCERDFWRTIPKGSYGKPLHLFHNQKSAQKQETEKKLERRNSQPLYFLPPKREKSVKNMNKDQTIGTTICLACIIVSAAYVGTVAAPELMKSTLPWLPWTAQQIQFGAIATVVLIAFLAIMFIGAWIGWTMATTPPPRPIEELETETKETTEKPKETTT